MCKSIWTNEVELLKFEALNKDIETDVLIIGGGMCGLLCGYYLQKSGIKCVIAEGDKIANGITKNTTAKITSLHGLVYNKIIKSYGKEKAEMYLGANNKALDEYFHLCKSINCEFEIKDAYTYSLDKREKIEEEVKAVQSIGYNAEFVTDTDLPFKTEGAIKFKNQAQFNPLKFVAKISENLEVYENTFVREIRGKYAITNNGKIKADKVIVATHFPFINKHGSYFLKLYQHRSYVSAYKNALNLNGMYVDCENNGMSFRNYKDYLFIGGMGHRTGKKSENWRGINKFALKYFPNAVCEYNWSTQDCMSLDGIPYIGHYSKNTPDLYVATGFNKWGMSLSMVSAMILSDMIQGKRNDCAEVFSPDRSIIKPQLFINGGEAVMNLLTPTAKRCPHLGCALKWNSAEHSWDCPCHGSRFDKKGKIIDNPATADMKKGAD